ncbi:hypothetical protein MTO96_015920 [Rhipicephalus appendiculatus]
MPTRWLRHSRVRWLQPLRKYAYNVQPAEAPALVDPLAEQSDPTTTGRTRHSSKTKAALHVDLHLSHLSACEGRLAECRYIVSHSSIAKVLTTEKCLAEIYLRLKIPVMLRGEVVNDIPSRLQAAW